MGSGIFFPICAIPFSLLIIILFYMKGHIENKETKIYELMIVVNLIGLVFEILCTVASMIYVDYPIVSKMIYKFYLLCLITWTSLIALYIYIISTSSKKEKESKTKLFYSFFLLVCVIVTFILPIDLVVENNFQTRYTIGASVDFTYIMCGVLIFFIVISLLRNYRNLKNKKYIPVYVFLIVGAVAIIIQIYNPEILMITYVEALIGVIMFFTIENPDVKMIEQLNIAKDQADKANRAKSDFLSSMSHEIRTPLNAIVGFSECILQENNIEDIHRDAKDVVMASQNLLEIVNGILDISKIEANKMEIVETDYELLPAIENIAKLMIPRIGEKPIELKTNFAVDIPFKMHGDIGKIKQIITNILTNAVKYTEKGKISFEVNCINENNTSSLVISIEDTGRGIQPDKIDKLFGKFDRLDEDRNTTIEGTGLGLAITKSLVDMLGGKIVVQSKYGEGSKFTVYLKQNIIKQHPDEEDTIEQDNVELTFDNSNILIVDDNKINLRVADKLLKKYNINTVLIESGVECIDKIEEGQKYDIIFMDDMMPRMTGTETLNRLKQIENFNIPVVALTANALSGEREKYINLGFDEYLAKPIEKIELEKVLSKFLEKTETAEEIGTKVLIVDDNKINIKVAENFLKPYNFNVESVLSGDECIQKVRCNNYDLIFMDDMMPVLNGVETFHKLRDEENFTNPVVALTANAINGAREHYLNEGFNEYISKPIDKKELDRVINLVLNSETIDTPVQEEISVKGNVEYLRANDVDIDTALGLLGDIEMYNETLTDFKENLTEKIIKLKRFKESNDMPNYAILVHSLKSDCKYLGFTKLAEMAYEHELKSKANDQDYVNNDFDNLVKECMRIKVIIDKY